MSLSAGGKVVTLTSPTVMLPAVTGVSPTKHFNNVDFPHQMVRPERRTHHLGCSSQSHLKWWSHCLWDQNIVFATQKKIVWCTVGSCLKSTCYLIGFALKCANKFSAVLYGFRFNVQNTMTIVPFCLYRVPHPEGCFQRIGVHPLCTFLFSCECCPQTLYHF